MDELQDWATYALRLAHSNSSHLSTLYSLSAWLHNLTYSYLLPLVNKVSQNPDLGTIALCLIILFISLKVLNMLWQAVMFWVRLVFRVVWWGGLVGLAVWMWTRGADGVAQDVGTLVGVWRGEYAYWKERAEGAGVVQQQPVRRTGWF